MIGTGLERAGSCLAFGIPPTVQVLGYKRWTEVRAFSAFISKEYLESNGCISFCWKRGEALGRLLKLQKEARRSDVQRRLREQYGDRDFVNRITRYVISSFLDWGVVAEKNRSGFYIPGKKVQPKASEHLAWLAEAVLISRNETQMSISKLCQHPILFPVSLELLTGLVVQENPRLKISRHSMNEEFVVIATLGNANRIHGLEKGSGAGKGVGSLFLNDNFGHAVEGKLSVNPGRKKDRLYTLDVFIISRPVRMGVVFVY